MDTDKIEKFYVDLQRKNHLDKCPFLVEWFNHKVKELNALPDDIDRSGVSKGDRLPVPKAKSVLALHHITFGKLPLKEYCDLTGVVYGTARNWKNTDQIFQEVVSDFATELSGAFLRRYSECMESKDPQGFAQAAQLIRECCHYQSFVQTLIIIELGKYGNRKLATAEEKPDFDALDLVKNHSLLFSTLLLSLEKKADKRRDYAKQLLDKEMEGLNAFFEKLRQNYKRREAQTVIDLAEGRAVQAIFYYTTILKEFIG